MISHDASLGMIHGWSANVSWGSGAKNLTARKSPDMLRGKIDTKRAPGRALNISTILKCTVFRGEAVRDGGRSPNFLFWIETAGLRVDVFGRFLVDFFRCP